MWLTKQRATTGPVFGSVDKFEGLGIFFDTYKNNRPGTVFPYVMAMIGDGNTAYDKEHDGKANELAGCSVGAESPRASWIRLTDYTSQARGIRNADIPTKARLTYFQDQNLVLALQYKEEGEWTECFDAPNVKIPSVAYLGFSAETGELSDNFDIVSVDTKNMYSTGATGAGGKVKETTKGKVNSKVSREGEGSWSWFFLKIVLFLVVCAGGYVGFTMYRSNKRSSRF